MIIPLTTPATFTIVPAQTKTFTQIVVKEIKDQPDQKIVTAMIQDYYKPIVLWTGADYDAIGQWTDSDVITKIQSVLGV